MRKNVPFLRSLSAIFLITSIARVSALSLMISLVSTSVCGQAQLLIDANNGEEMIEGEYHSFTVAGSYLYFISRNKELWRTTGTTGGTQKIASFNSIGKMVASGSYLYFVADNGTFGLELWRTNGTASGTVLVKDITQWAASTEIGDLVASPAGVYFVAKTPSGKEVWKSNGTFSGTMMVKDIVPGPGSSFPTSLVMSAGKLFFAANDGKHGQELWMSDGTPEGTVMVKDIVPGEGQSSHPQQLFDINGTVYFSAVLAETGRELWKSNGTPEGTVMVKDVAEGTKYSGIENLNNVNGWLFFTATDGIHGHELWKSNGSPEGTVMVKDMTPGPDGSHGDEEYNYFSEPMRNFYSANGFLYYTAYQNFQLKVWRSDGTDAGTIAIQDMHPQGMGWSLPAFARISANVYYFNLRTDAETGEESYWLWRISPTSKTPVPVVDFSMGYNPSYGYNLEQEMVTFNNTLFFNRVVENGYRLFKSHGTAETTTIVKDVVYEGMSSDPELFGTAKGLTYFTGYSSWEEAFYGTRATLWRTDGTANGTDQIHWAEQIYPLPAVNNTTYFTEGYGALNIWKTDGTESGTKLVDESFDAGSITHSATANNLLFVGTWRGRIWRSDGTPSGTFQIKAVPEILSMYSGGNLMFFTVRNNYGQLELWRSNGSASGTFRVKNFNSAGGRPIWAHQNFAHLNGIFYFIVNDGIHGAEVWRSDGTTTGTYLFADLNASDNYTMGSFDFDIASMYVFGNRLYISARDNDGLWKLYQSDGTSTPTAISELFPVARMTNAGGKLLLFATYTQHDPQAITREVFLWATDGTAEDLRQLSQQQFSYRVTATIVDGVAYFPAMDGSLFRSDGTECGSYNFITGVRGTNFMQALGNKVVFASYRQDVGSEPFVFDLALAPTRACDPESESMQQSVQNTSTPDIFRTFPNPFTNEFALDVMQPGQENATIQVFTSNGYPVETITDVGSTITMGQSWKPGMYILKVQQGSRLETRMIIKK